MIQRQNSWLEGDADHVTALTGVGGLHMSCVLAHYRLAAHQEDVVVAAHATRGYAVMVHLGTGPSDEVGVRVASRAVIR